MSDKSLVANGERVLVDLNALRAMGAYQTGVHRPTFSEPHMRSLAWLVERFPEAGLTGSIDGVGNVLGRSPKPGPKLLAGSHLESQNFAGWLDGPLGVVYALEAARVINSDPSARGTVEVAAWCDEEGHFGHFLGSRSCVGLVSEADIDAARDRTSGRTMREALRDVGLAGPRASPPSQGGMSDIWRPISSRATRLRPAALQSASSRPSCSHRYSGQDGSKISGCNRSREHSLGRWQVHPHAQRRRPRCPGSRHNHACGHAVCAFDRRHQSSLGRKHQRCRHRQGCAGLCRNLPALVGRIGCYPLAID